MRISRVLLLWALLPLLWACSSHSFDVEGDVSGLGTKNVHMVYVSDNGLVDDMLAAHDGKFSYTGSSSALTVVSVFDPQGEMLAQFAVKNGDHIVLKGTLQAGQLLEASGNDVTEQWTRFRSEHASLYDGKHAAELNTAIEKWAKEHTKDVTATLLLLFDHNDLLGDKQATKLLEGMAPEARADHLATAVQWLSEYRTKHTDTKLFSLMLCGTSGDFEVLNMNNRSMLLRFWSKKNRENRKEDVAAIKAKLRTGDLAVADVLLDADTLGWAAACRADSATWHHYWAPGGPVDQAIRELHIAAAPWYVVTDSTGRVTYNGPSLTDALK